jgi:uncharacterized protein YhaN
MGFRLFSQRFAQLVVQLRAEEKAGAALRLPLDASHIWSCVDGAVVKAAAETEAQEVAEGREGREGREGGEGGEWRAAGVQRLDVCGGGESETRVTQDQLAKHAQTAERAIEHLEQAKALGEGTDKEAQLAADLAELRSFLRRLAA